MKKTFKRLIPVLLALILVLGIMPVTASAESGTCGSGVNWSLENGTLSITGSGEMSNFSASVSAPWDTDDLRDRITSVVVGSGVTKIGNYAFYGLDNLSSVTFSEGLKTLGTYVFYFCPSLRELTFPSTMENIGSNSFSNNVSNDVAYGAIETITFRSANLAAVGSNLFKASMNKDVKIYVPAGFSIRGVPAAAGKTGEAPFYSNYCIFTDGKATVSWENEDGTVLLTDSVNAGTVPSYSGTLPVKEPDEAGSYVFSGWDPAPGAVSANKLYIYKAQFTVEEPDTGTALIGDTEPVDGDYIRMGGIRWHVIGENKESGLRLLAAAEPTEVTMTWEEAFEHSKSVYDSFKDAEKDTVVPVTKDDAGYVDVDTVYNGVDLEEATVFFLSASEAAYYYGDAESMQPGGWWVRSVEKGTGNHPCVRSLAATETDAPPSTSTGSHDSGSNPLYEAKDDGGENPLYKQSSPAFLQDTKNIIIAYGTDALNTEGAFVAVSGPEGQDKRPVIIESGYDSFEASAVSEAFPGGTVAVTYSGARTDDNSYVSAILTGEHIQEYYACAKPDPAGSGTLEFTLPEDLPGGNYSLTVFSGEISSPDSFESDIASRPVELQFDVRNEITLLGNSLTLEGDIGLNFYYYIPDVTGDTYAEFNYAGDSIRVPVDLDSYKIIGGVKAYKFTFDVPPARISEYIECIVFNGISQSDMTSYSVTEYIAESRELDNDSLNNLMSALYEYGYRAHLLFEPETFFDESYSIPAPPIHIGMVSPGDFEPNMPSNINDESGLNHIGMSLVLRSKTAIRHYFTIPAGKTVGDYEFRLWTDEGDSYALMTPHKSGRYYYVEIPDIPSGRLDSIYHIYVMDSEGIDVNSWHYSALSYGYLVMNNTEGEVSQELIYVCKALYLYSKYANEYFGD